MLGAMGGPVAERKGTREAERTGVSRIDSSHLSGSVAHYLELTRGVHNELRFERSYNDDVHMYYIVVNPLKDKYEKNKPIFQSKKFIDMVEKYLKINFEFEWYIITREVMANMIHLNVLILTDKEYSCQKLTGAVNHYYGFHVQYKNADLKTRLEIVNYIFKEAKERQMDKYLDYVYKKSDTTYEYTLPGCFEDDYPDCDIPIHIPSVRVF